MEIIVGLCFLIGVAIVGGLVVVALIFALVRAVRSSATTPFGAGASFGSVLSNRGMLSNGTPARGILLSVASTGTRTTYKGQRYEIRRGRVDIEAQGMRPYEIDTNVYIPSNLLRDALPGSTVELRITPSDQSKVVVFGPDVGYTQGTVRSA